MKIELLSGMKTHLKIIAAVLFLTQLNFNMALAQEKNPPWRAIESSMWDQVQDHISSLYPKLSDGTLLSATRAAMNVWRDRASFEHKQGYPNTATIAQIQMNKSQLSAHDKALMLPVIRSIADREHLAKSIEYDRRAQESIRANSEVSARWSESELYARAQQSNRQWDYERAVRALNDFMESEIQRAKQANPDLRFPSLQEFAAISGASASEVKKISTDKKLSAVWEMRRHAVWSSRIFALIKPPGTPLDEHWKKDRLMVERHANLTGVQYPSFTKARADQIVVDLFNGKEMSASHLSEADAHFLKLVLQEATVFDRLRLPNEQIEFRDSQDLKKYLNWNVSSELLPQGSMYLNKEGTGELAKYAVAALYKDKMKSIVQVLNDLFKLRNSTQSTKVQTQIENLISTVQRNLIANPDLFGSGKDSNSRLHFKYYFEASNPTHQSNLVYFLEKKASLADWVLVLSTLKQAEAEVGREVKGVLKPLVERTQTGAVMCRKAVQK